MDQEEQKSQQAKSEHDEDVAHDAATIGEDLATGIGAAADVLMHGVAGAATGIADGIDAVRDTPEQPKR